MQGLRIRQALNDIAAGEEIEVSGCDCENTGEAGGEATALLPLAFLTLGLRRRRE